jgi:acyl carrier protein
MQRNEIIEKVNLVMHQGFEIPWDKIKPEASLYESLELDSLDAVDMIVALEEKIGRRVNIERFKSARTLNDIYDIVGELTAESASKT